MPSSRVTISRTLPSDLGMRHVDVFIDGARVGTLLNGQSLTHAVTAGHHVVKVHNTMVGKTAEFDVAEGGHVRFATASRKGFGSSLIWLLGAGPMYVELERLAETDHPPA